MLKSLEVGSLNELHLIAKSLDRCPLHSNNSFPKFEFTCYYKEHLPSSIGNLEKLISLGICRCTKPESFSGSICSRQYLRKLKLEGSIPEVPVDLPQLECLEELYLLSTDVKHLPDSICMLKHLKSLYVKSCLRLEKLPEGLGQLECLEDLILLSTDIKHLPDSLCMLKHLKSLKVESCRHLEKLPEDLGRLECLEELSLLSISIKHLPDSICMLKHLKSLKVESCLHLEKLPEDLGKLECLEELSLKECKSIIDVPNNICNMKCLRCFNLIYCTRVEKLPEELGHLECLKVLEVKGTGIRHLPQSISLLKDLHVYGFS